MIEANFTYPGVAIHILIGINMRVMEILFTVTILVSNDKVQQTNISFSPVQYMNRNFKLRTIWKESK